MDGEDYAVVGVPKNKELEGRGGVVLARQVAAARKEYFKPGGRLDLEMKNPRETLTNKELVGRAKERLDFNSAFQEVLVNKSAVHPETVATMKENGQTLFWAENVDNYRDVASREDMNWLGIPVMTNTKKINPGQIAKNEKGDFLMEQRRAPAVSSLWDKVPYVSEAGIRILDLKKVDQVFHKTSFRRRIERGGDAARKDSRRHRGVQKLCGLRF